MIPDTNAIIRAYLLTKPTLTDLVSSRIYCPRLPENTTLPAISFFTRGGGANPHVKPIIAPSVQFDCWANDPMDAREIYRALFDSLQGVQMEAIGVGGDSYMILSAREEVQGQDLVDQDIQNYFRTLTFFEIMVRGTVVNWGLDWVDLGVVVADWSDVIAYLGNGIAVLGTEDGHIHKTTNHGATWVDLGNFPGSCRRAKVNFGNGIVVFTGTSPGNTMRSADYGATWAAATIPGVFGPFQTGCYLESGIGLLGENSGHVFRTTDYGANWVDLGQIEASLCRDMVYLGDGVVLLSFAALGVENHYKSIDYGLTWADLGVVWDCYFAKVSDDNLIAVGAGAGDGHIYQSDDSGTTWTDLGVFSAGKFTRVRFIGNGTLLAGDSLGHIFRSVDYGSTWTDLGVIGDWIEDIEHFGDGIVLAGDHTTHLYRSTPTEEDA